MPGITLQSLLQQHFPAFSKNHSLPLYQHKTIRHLMDCRTAKLGGHTQYCENGHVNGVWYNSCKDRSCPQCKGIRSERWLLKTDSVLLRCPHHHIIFTLPHDLNLLWIFNRSLMADILFRAVQETLNQLSKDKRYLNAKPGYMNALHTWGRNLSLHPHLHCLITHGGLASDNTWREPKKKCLFPRKVVMMIFRGKINAFIKEAMSQALLIIPPSETSQEIINLCNKLGRKEWVVHFCKRYEHGKGVASYLAKYVRGGPLKNSQLQAIGEKHIRFSYTSHQSQKSESIILSATDFIKRWLNHIPIPKKRAVRNYSLYNPKARAALNVARLLHRQKEVSEPQQLAWQDYLENMEITVKCSVCGAGLYHGNEQDRTLSEKRVA